MVMMANVCCGYCFHRDRIVYCSLQKDLPVSNINAVVKEWVRVLVQVERSRRNELMDFYEMRYHREVDTVSSTCLRGRQANVQS